VTRRRDSGRAPASTTALAGSGDVKILTYVSDNLPVGGVVGALDADDLRRHRRIMFLQVVDELSLGDRRTEDQDLVGVRQLVRDGGEKSALIVRVIADLHLRGLLMTVDMSRDRFQRLLVERLADVKDPRLVVVHPSCHVTHGGILQQD
jgi:hypothetical protein